jgi:hypothetical protein
MYNDPVRGLILHPCSAQTSICLLCWPKMTKGIIKLLDGEVLDAIIALNLQSGTVAMVMSLLVAMPAFDVLGGHHLSHLHKGHTLAVLLGALCPCWDLVVAHKLQ